jgi:hypothetical protein
VAYELDVAFHVLVEPIIEPILLVIPFFFFFFLNSDRDFYLSL